MKIIFGILMLMSTVQAAAKSPAASPVHEVLSCGSKHAGPDFGLDVAISYDMTARSFSATLTSQSIAGPRPVGTWAVEKSQNGDMEYYTNRNRNNPFTLKFQTTTHDSALSYGLTTRIIGMTCVRLK
jgi:hypothetical protein